MRFIVLHQRIPGISRRSLTLTLRHLERDGLVARTVFAGDPLKTEFELTAMGRTLIGPAAKLAEWADRARP